MEGKLPKPVEIVWLLYKLESIHKPHNKAGQGDFSKYFHKIKGIKSNTLRSDFSFKFQLRRAFWEPEDKVKKLIDIKHLKHDLCVKLDYVYNAGTIV